MVLEQGEVLGSSLTTPITTRKFHMLDAERKKRTKPEREW